MIQIKKTILTLVALLAITAAATGPARGQNSTTYNVTFGGFYRAGMNITVSVASLPQTFTQINAYVLYPWQVLSSDGDEFTSASVTSGGEGKVSVNIPAVSKMTITVTGTFEGTATIHVEGIDENEEPISRDITVSCPAPPAPSGPEVDWNKTSKTGTFDMPGGNVELEPEYYPQATLAAAPTAADGAKATTDDLLVSGGTVATITGSDPAAPQGTLMYYVSTSTMTTEALLALDADMWVAEPTAAGITQKCGAFVYYYVKGNDSTDDALNFSDGDISSDNVLNVPIFPAPTYAVTFADDLAEPTLWTADPNTDVTKGQTVTVTYTGSKKVIGVKAEKKAAPKLLTLNVGGVYSGTLTYAEGETWGQAIENHPTENTGWTIGEGGAIILNTYYVYLEDNRVRQGDAITPGLGYYTE